MIEEITIPFLSLESKIKELESAGKTITQMTWEKKGYTLTYRWAEQDEMVMKITDLKPGLVLTKK